MRLRVLYFGKLAEITRLNNEVFESNCNGDLDTFMEEVYEVYPNLKTVDFQIAINKELGNRMVVEGDEVAFLPPFAGG